MRHTLFSVRVKWSRYPTASKIDDHKRLRGMAALTKARCLYMFTIIAEIKAGINASFAKLQYKILVSDTTTSTELLKKKKVAKATSLFAKVKKFSQKRGADITVINFSVITPTFRIILFLLSTVSCNGLLQFVRISLLQSTK